jgi:pimeloyl-ACP methyl ester carboxylesterase
MMKASVQLLPVESGTLGFATRGAGPSLLVPWCNLPWPELPVIDRLAERYHVVLASPRGYQRSSRLGPDENYSLDTSVRDLLAVCDAVGIDEFAVLGYSLSAVVAGWLACTSARVTRAALGGFPLLGSYASVLQSAERDVEQLTGDLGFDPRAALDLYRDLAELADGALVDDRRCPMRAFWGSDDTVLQGFDIEPDLADALTARGVEAAVVAGADHVTTLLDTNAIMSALSGAAP